MRKMLFCRNHISAVYWFRYITGNVPSALLLDSHRLIFKINDDEYRLCSLTNHEMITRGQPRDTKFYYNVDVKFEENFEKALEEITNDRY